ncbi:MAG TPA: hypothetical protein VFK89_08725 [Actinomycetota bacterium]|nr:hypothetical protein [Actinomycetota bacterium]
MNLPRRPIATILVAGAMLLAVAMPGAGAAEQKAAASDVREVGRRYRYGRDVPVQGPSEVRRVPASRVAVGAQRDWVGLDDVRHTYYIKPFTLRAEGDHAQVWVASGSDSTSSDLEFPSGDCRNDERVEISDTQVHYLLRQFDNNIWPKEAKALSVAPRRNGSDATLPNQVRDRNGHLVYPRDYWSGPGRKIVILVDNVRDSNFYDTDNQHNNTYIAGFFSRQVNELVDRNVMTIDAFDWVHRTGAHPPNAPTNDPCTNKVAKPFLYEQVFAHEYQHLLESYQDENEAVWVDEGMADWAMRLTGYADPRRPITDNRFDNHIWAFLGFLGTATEANPVPRVGGPENSLTMWGDQGDGRILDDYGAAWTFMETLAARYGNSFMGDLHRERASGLRGLRAVLRDRGIRITPRQLIHNWSAGVALDGVLDDGAVLTGGNASRYRTRTLDATIDWDTPAGYASSGAPPNGADFVRLRSSDGTYLGASDVESIAFTSPDPTHHFTVQLVAYDDQHRGAWIARLPIGANGTGSLSGAALHEAIGDSAETVAAIVSFDAAPGDREYATYELDVNGVTQPGGS